MIPSLCDSHHLSELRIVLIGYSNFGKSSSGNIILGREEFDTEGRTAQSEKRYREVAGRHITVVEAPGWNKFITDETACMTKENIELILSLCPPGPHALLLIIGVNRSFTDKLRRSVQQHLELLGERVWSHTMVLFTHGDRLGDTPIEQHIESEGESLQWLVEKCGNRYNVFNNERRDDHMQVTQLMEKIEEMVAGNRGNFYEILIGDPDRWSLNSSANSSFRSARSFASSYSSFRSVGSFASAYSSFRSHIGPEEEGPQPVRKARSKDIIPPLLSGDSDSWSFSSAYSSFRSAGSFASAYSSFRSPTGPDEQQPVRKARSKDIIPPLYHDDPDERDLRIVLLGYRDAGKSSSGNTILGREEFDTARRTAQCVKRQGEVAQRHVTVVEAPGWHTVITEDTPNMTKEKIKLSMSLNPPGPHALLLVMSVERPFTKKDRMSVQKHLELLGERVWSHTLVLFTRGDLLGDTPIDQHIESEGESLQWLVEKCGNRYHVLNNERRDDHMQVTQLMEKIEEMLAANRGQCYEMERWRIEELEEKMMRDEKRGKKRMMKVKRERKSFRSQMGDSLHLSELRIVLLGSVKEGKSSSGNTILGSQKFDTAGRTTHCVKRQGEVAGRHITVVEAPGWYGLISVFTPRITKKQIKLSVSLCPPGPHALLLAIIVKKSFTEAVRGLVQKHLELLGERVWGHTIVLFTYGDQLGDTPIEQYIETDGESLQWLVEKCGNRYHVFNNKRRDDHMQVTQLMEKIEEMLAANRARCNSHHLPELKIVLLGNRASGKSSSGNTILGRQEFDTERETARSVEKHGEVAGRHITLVEAPGWKTFNIDNTPNKTKEEIKLSVSLCPPGPHAVLMVIDMDLSFTEELRRSVQEHLELLGVKAWSFSIVLFTNVGWLGDTSIEQYIESEGESLQWLVEKCGNRYNVFNNERRDDHMQVSQLMEKIEEMVASNTGQCYEMERWRIEELEQKRRGDEERGKERMMKVMRERDSLRSQMGDSHHLPELRIVLLGYIEAGKSLSGNTILGREEFDTVGRTAQCVKRQGEVAGRHITVVEAPGWGWGDTLDQTPKMIKEEIQLSGCLCIPGPHTLLLVISRSFKEEQRRSVQEHMEILGERGWSHTIVLFTYGDRLEDTPIEQYIESEGESLQWLIAKCGNRYHVLNNEKSDDHMQVTQLMEKIEEMVAANRGQCFEMDRLRKEQLEHKRRLDEERVKERMMAVKKDSESLRSQMGDSHHLSELRFLLLGIKCEGKSTSGNTILGREEFGTAGITAESVKQHGEVAGRHITVVEAPGWTKSTTEDTPSMSKEDIELSVSLCPPGPHALLLIIGVNRSFTDKLRRSVQKHLELLGERVWSHTLVLFTRGDLLGDTPIDQHIEIGGESLQWLVEKCGNRYHVFNNKRRDDHMQVTQLMKKIEEMVAANRGQCYESC
ncbi:uncharacterized protein LOC134461464 [Engraulis encrasicolus]|uniref:uncharacterized protein LOC134461464 n=1 Tax=Engraulis encrasicolus TaxID=184585 RepID=UPI002FD27EAC